MKSTVKTIVSLAIIGAALYFSNPTMPDFGSFYQRKLVAESQKGDKIELVKQIAKALSETAADAIVKLGFKRDDKLFFSTYTLGSASNPSERYLGFAKLVFIKLK